MALLQVWFDGIELSKYLKPTMGKDELILPKRTDDPVDIGSRDGPIFRSTHFNERVIEMPFIIDGGDVRKKARQIAQILYTKEPKKLIFSDHMDRYWLAIPEGEISLPEDDSVNLTGTIKWVCYEPFSYAMQEDEFTLDNEEKTENFVIDFKGKIKNDLTSNPNSIWGAEDKENESRTPDSFWWEWYQNSYAVVQQEDGHYDSYTRDTEGNSTRLMMKFDVLKSIDKVYPGFWQKYGIVDKNAKLEWLRANMTHFEFDCWSFGREANGFGVIVQLWNGTEWVGIESNTASSPYKNTYSFNTANEAINYIDSDGYFYAMTATNDASATDKTVIYLDYACLNISATLPVTESLEIQNDGPLPVPVRFEVTNKGDNGFFGFSNGDQSILVGNPSEEDGGILSKSERIFTTNQNNTNGLKQWTINNATINTSNEKATQSGAFEDPSVIKEKRWRLRNAQADIKTAWGAGDSSGRGWHGPSATAEFATDSQGATGAVNFTARFYVQFLFGNMSQSGLQQCNLVGPDKELLVCVQMWKDVNKHNGFSIRIGDKGWIYRDNNNARWDNFFGSIEIKRYGNTYTINIQNVEGSGPKTKQTVTYDDSDSAAIKCQNVSYWKARWGNVTKHNNVMYNDLYDFWIQKDNVEHYVDIPNLFHDGDVLKVEDNKGAVESNLNGTLILGYQEIGSKSIIAKPGRNTVAFMYSDFASAPEVKAYIRKKYI
ncbi:distal tail protein Dit [Paucilactobacillus sp. N302-9]